MRPRTPRELTETARCDSSLQALIPGETSDPFSFLDLIGETLTRGKGRARAPAALCNPVSKFRREVKQWCNPTYVVIAINLLNLFCCPVPRASPLFRMYRFTWTIRGITLFAGTMRVIRCEFPFFSPFLPFFYPDNRGNSRRRLVD